MHELYIRFYLVGGLEHDFYFPIQLGMSDVHIFGMGWNHQPAIPEKYQLFELVPMSFVAVVLLSEAEQSRELKTLIASKCSERAEVLSDVGAADPVDLGWCWMERDGLGKLLDLMDDMWILGWIIWIHYMDNMDVWMETMNIGMLMENRKSEKLKLSSLILRTTSLIHPW